MANSELQALRDLRSKLAFAENQKHSYSFSDEELDRLLRIRPKTLDELGKIKGFPRSGKRVKSFGQLIVDIFNGKSVENINVSTTPTDLKVTYELKKSSSFI